MKTSWWHGANRYRSLAMLTTLFLDLNSYFASVEQQVQPHLRGRAMAVAPITGDSGCIIAASYEAKAFQVKTGTRVGEAKMLCPGVEIVDARPRLYVLMHHRILKAIDRHIPVDQVHSIDEVSCKLDRTQRTPEAARKLAERIKAEIRASCGVCMRCSIGIAPNRLLAKLGTDLMKPDGLVILRDEDLPGRIAELSPQELSGIGPQMTKKLKRAGVKTIGELYAKSEAEMRALWGGPFGERWYHAIRGAQVRERTTKKGSIGHQHVLAPALRTREGAKSVALRLLLKASARMRHDKYAAKKVSLGLRFMGDKPSLNAWNGPSWDEWAPLGDGCVDSGTMQEALDDLWTKVPEGNGDTILMVSVTLHDLVPAASHTLPLFGGQSRSESLSKAMDAVNKKFGANKVYPASMQDVRSHGTGGIAFNYVPNLEIADSVQSRQRDGDGERGTGEKTKARYLTDAQMEGMIEASLRVR
jgi:DNA polymerase-4